MRAHEALVGSEALRDRESCEVDFRPAARGGSHIAQRARSTCSRASSGRSCLPERIVWTFEWLGAPGHIPVDTVTFEEHDGKTTLTTTSLFDSVEDRDGMLQSGMEAGAAETYDRLEEYVETLKWRVAG